MKYEFVVAIRNDQHQILVLVDRNSNLPVLPTGSSDGEPVLSAIRKQVLADTGLSVGGLHLASEDRARAQEPHVFCYTAFVSGGKLRSPLGDKFSSASWVSPELGLRVTGLRAAARGLLMSLSSWVTEGPPR